MPTPKPTAKKAKASSKAGYRMPEPMPEGLVLTGMTGKKKWILGPSIGVGGFGEIYCGSEEGVAAKYDQPLAIKIEPHENGPLFVEMNFYLRAAAPESIESFKSSRKLSSLGMPVHRGSGSHTFNGTKYRFLVMDRFGTDLQKLFDASGRKFSERNVFNLAIRILDVLEYIHSQGYVHNDVKAQNLLLGLGAQQTEVFLVDFGLACRFLRDDKHVVLKADPRKAHDGTVEYTSRDAHIGVHARRSDLEVLGYNLVHWLSGTLPWMDNLTSPEYVHEEKKQHMGNISLFLKTCFKTSSYPGELEEFLRHVSGLDFATEPDYRLCRNLFIGALTKRKFPLDLKLDFSAKSTTATATAQSTSRAKEVRVMTPTTPKTPRTARLQRVQPPTPTTPITPKTGRATRAGKTVSFKSSSEIRSESIPIRDNRDRLIPRTPRINSPRAASAKSIASAEEALTAAAKPAPPKPSNPEMLQFMRKAMSAAAKASKRSHRVEGDVPDPSLDNPTPNMVEIMEKRARKQPK